MPKNSQYGRWRRAAMQVVVWVILGGTLALAWYVGNRRTASMGATLGEPVTFGSLKVRLPSGWQRKTPPMSNPQALVVKEKDEEGRERREFWITQERQSPAERGPTFYLESVFLNRLPVSRPEPFAFLGARGVVITWRGIPDQFLDDLDEELGKNLPAAGLYACVVLPDGLTVTLQLRGTGAYGPTNQRLLRAVADSLKLSDIPATQSASAQGP